MFEVSAFAFLAEPPAAAAGGRICDACGDGVRGFVYHSDDPDLDLHPCCAFLRRRVVVQDGRHFELRKRAPLRRPVRREERPPPQLLGVPDLRRRRRTRVPAHRVRQGRTPRASVPRRRTPRSGGFERFCKIVNVVVSVIIAVIFGNPMAMIIKMILRK
uniref:DC1 domain-containing protein n=1 Tax=Oryza rufipogon TaxID=4529 RepID=A0A0E0QIS0_ORYRU